MAAHRPHQDKPSIGFSPPSRNSTRSSSHLHGPELIMTGDRVRGMDSMGSEHLLCAGSPQIQSKWDWPCHLQGPGRNGKMRLCRAKWQGVGGKCHVRYSNKECFLFFCGFSGILHGSHLLSNVMLLWLGRDSQDKCKEPHPAIWYMYLSPAADALHPHPAPPGTCCMHCGLARLGTSRQLSVSPFQELQPMCDPPCVAPDSSFLQ